MKTLKSYNMLHISSETLPATEAKASALLQITYILDLVILQDYTRQSCWRYGISRWRCYGGGEVARCRTAAVAA